MRYHGSDSESDSNAKPCSSIIAISLGDSDSYFLSWLITTTQYDSASDSQTRKLRKGRK